MKKIAAVTGGAQGLGFAIAKALVARGYHVAIIGRRIDALERAAAELGDATAVQADIGVPGEAARAFARIDELGGQLDVLVNNAGVFVAFPIDEADDEQVLSVVQPNLLGSIYCAREAVRRMKKSGTGDIINITSDAADAIFPLLSVYGATKAALEQFTFTLNAEFRGTDIRATAVRSSRMKTEGAMQGMSGSFAKRFYQAAVESGAAFHAGQGMDPASVALRVCALLDGPRDGFAELIVIRSA